VSRRGWVLFAAMSLIWGVPYLLIKIAVGGVSVPVVVFVRTGLAALLLLPIVVRRGQLGALRGHWPVLLAFATIEIVAPWFLLSDAERHLSSSLSGLLIASVPIIGFVLGRFFGDRRSISLARWAGLLLGLSGVALLAGPGLHGGGAWPVTEVLLTAFGYACGPLIASRKLGDVPSLPVVATSLAFAAVCYAPAAVLTAPTRMPPADVLLALGGLAVVCTAIAFVVFFALIAEAGPARSTVITYLNPAVAVALGALVLGERITLSIGVAFVLILAGSVLASRAPAAPAPGEVPATPPAPVADRG
jgi:drug/metabolite transporter (DMT)-like permease